MQIKNSIQTVVLSFLLLIPTNLVARKSSKRELIEDVEDVKQFKKLLRTKTNLLVIYAKSDKAVSKLMPILSEVADEVRGTGTLIYVNCGEAKKLCKKSKASPSTVELKHYKDGEYNKDYDRKNTVKSMVSFMRDPTGEIPWEEDSTAGDVVHIEHQAALNKLITKEKKPLLVMFYAPWCGFCKRIKPDYASAATELKGESVMAGMDVDKPENMNVRTAFNITGFPTILYFEKGQMKYKYGGENTKDGLVSWMRDPQPPKEPEKEAEWSDAENDVEHLTDENFDTFTADKESVLVMFYAPWCGHCKKMKPEYEQAASELKEEGVSGIIAAVDATKSPKVAQKYEVKGYPTVKFFSNGESKWDFNERTAEKIVEFMKNPVEPPPPPPPEPEWSEVESDVEHLTDETFKSTLKKRKHCLVMFYAPWCGHCKRAKPEFMAAAAQFKDDRKVSFAAVDCTKHQSTCSAFEVSGYPTLKYFNYGKDAQTYSGGREERDFVNFMNDPLNPLSSSPPAPPAPEESWSDLTGADQLTHLTDNTFNEFINQHESVLVMFYAPWCGHCKAMKPAYAEAAQELSTAGISGKLSTVDAQQERVLAGRFDIKGYPTIKYFKNGEMQFDYTKGRTTEDLVAFMKDPKAPPPPPPAEPAWSDTPSEVNHLTDATFNKFVTGTEHTLVMFYAPWCGHCKKAKPEYQLAADELKADASRKLAAVDCTDAKCKDTCKRYDVSGYPTFKYFYRGQGAVKYEAGRQKADFVKYLMEPPSPTDSKVKKEKEEL
ncbi:unnamed protein product [Owenia fusiformis]|uniref:Thioredoxin domain-containing protein n=1 Tax=Owenia fusiformis TaxID=6347 RepID=A0A8S4N3I2_OWEFU|nr:unnamed protein product [Owenia fusiformis]